MRRTLLSLIAGLFVFNIAFSQNIYLVAGLSGSHISLSYTDVPDFYDSFPVLAPNIGIYYEAELSRSWSLKPGILVNKQGKKMVSEPTSGYYVDNKYLISYIEVPFMLTYKFRRSNKRDLHMSLSTGPYYSYGYYGKFISTNNAFYEEENVFVGSEDLYRSNFGATLMFTAGFDNHRISAYVSPGIRNLAQDGGIFNKFRTLSAGINYNFILHTNLKRSGFILKKMLY